MKIIITIIRIAVGWHFLYEGYIKLFASEWSAESYLSNTYGVFSGFYHWLAGSPARLAVVDFFNIWGLIFIGLSLFIGLFVRWAALAGALLLSLYYFAYPPFGITLLGGDGTTFIINQLFIETAILVFFFFCRERGYGIDEAINLFKREQKSQDASLSPATLSSFDSSTRRLLLKNLVSLPFLGLFGWSASRKNKLYGIDTLTGATIQINQVALGELKGVLPKGKLGNFELSRLIMGGNLIGGWAHARDLIYVDKLFRAYNNERKIFETLILCEQAGINCINIAFSTIETMVKYKKITGSKMTVIAQVGINNRDDDMFVNADYAADQGVDIIQLQGNWCDWLVRDNRLEVIDGMMNRIRKNGIIAGMGAHTIDSLIVCEENGIIPDYYMKSMHHDNYWSAHPSENRKAFEVDGARSSDHNMFHDNCFCPFPDRTVEFVNRVQVPVMGFKVLAAGAIQPKDGFNWAFENGADFICVGMFDFQVVEDVNVCIDTLENLQNRKREWYG